MLSLMIAALIAAASVAFWTLVVMLSSFLVVYLVEAMLGLFQKLGGKRGIVIDENEKEEFLTAVEERNPTAGRSLRNKFNAKKMSFVETDDGYTVKALDADDTSNDEFRYGANVLNDGSYIVYDEYGQGKYYDRNGNYLGLAN